MLYDLGSAVTNCHFLNILLVTQVSPSQSERGTTQEQEFQETILKADIHTLPKVTRFLWEIRNTADYLQGLCSATTLLLALNSFLTSLLGSYSPLPSSLKFTLSSSTPCSLLTIQFQSLWGCTEMAVCCIRKGTFLELFMLGCTGLSLTGSSH